MGGSMLKQYWPGITIISISAVLMQWHSIAFWNQYAGASGVGFSLALEVVALWLWWQRRSWLALTASILLIGGPLFQLSSPIFDTMSSAQASERMTIIYQAEIAQLSESLQRYDNNSASRLGWASRIDRAQAALDAARNKLRVLAAQERPDAIRLHLVVIMQALALIVIMRAQILAVAMFPLVASEPGSGKGGSKVWPPVPWPGPPSVDRIQKKHAVHPVTAQNQATPRGQKRQSKKADSASNFDTRVAQIAKIIKNQLKLARYEGKQRLLALDIGVRPADVSMVLNHVDRKKAGKEILSLPKLDKMEKFLLEAL